MRHCSRDFGVLLLTAYLVTGAATRVLQRKAHHLEDLKFASQEYLDPEIDERDSGPEPPISPLDQPLYSNVLNYSVAKPSKVPDKLDKNIKWDSSWGAYVDFGQISAVSVDPNGNVAVFHRGSRVWDASTFGSDNKFDYNKGPIVDNTIILLDKNGRPILQWGSNMFYLPHGLTVDALGNYWITDVAMHQVFKFDAKELEKHHQQLRKRSRNSQRAILMLEQQAETIDLKNLFANSVVKPSITLGEAFQPGNDNIRFCKPTAVAVASNGDFFVSDGYCNSRVIKFNKDGERILQWGRTWGFEGLNVNRGPPPANVFFIPHALALAEEHDYIFVADRENARIVCSFASNGSIHKEYKNPVIGEAIYSIAYANDRIYLVNGNRLSEDTHIRGFILDIHTGEILSQFAPRTDMNMPHDIAVTSDERQIYVVELNIHRIYKFDQDVKVLKSKSPSNKLKTVTDSQSAGLSEVVNGAEQKKPSQKGLIIATITAALFFIGFCIFLAALLAKYQKRGCLFPPHKRRTTWEADRNENFRLSNLLVTRKKFKLFQGRPNTRDFSKLNTEPETSDDENPENSLERII